MLLKRLACCVLAVCSEANTTLLVPRAGRKEWETSNSPHDAKWSEQLRFDDDGGSQNPVEFLLIAPPYASHGTTSPWTALGSDSVYS